MEIEYRDQHGRKVTQQQWARGLEEAAFDEAQRELKQAIKRVRCPEHGQTITNLRATKASGGLTFRWDSCCEQLNEGVERALS